jgi:CheY-like chemotaxis protein
VRMERFKRRRHIPHDICVSCHLNKKSLPHMYLPRRLDPIWENTRLLKRSEGHAMALDLFSRKLVLLVEDEPLIAYDVENNLRNAGARVISAGYLDAALSMAEHPDLSAAVVDLRLGDDCAIPICRRLSLRDLPFVVHTGYVADAVRQEWPGVPIIHKPAIPGTVTRALADCLRPHDAMRQPFLPAAGTITVDSSTPQ